MKLFHQGLVFAILLALTPLAWGQNYIYANADVYTDSGDHSFETAQNWSLGNVPTSTNAAEILPSLNQTVAINQGSDETVGVFLVGNSGLIAQGFNGQAKSGIVNYSTANVLTVNTLYDFIAGDPSEFAVVGGATLNVSGGGTFKVQQGQIRIGDTGGTGTLSFDSSTFNYVDPVNATSLTGQVGQFVIGAGTNGTLTLNGSSTLSPASSAALKTYQVIIGANVNTSLPNTTGTLNINDSSTFTVNTGGDLQLGSTAVDFNSTTVPTGTTGGTGIINQGGTNTTVSLIGSSTAEFGDVTGGIGTYNLSGPSTNTLTINNTSTSLGAVANATGTINQSGGTLVVGATSFIIGDKGTGAYNLSGGTATFNTTIKVGNASGSIGSITQNGGTLTANDLITIGTTSGSTGSYSLSNGTATLDGGLTVGGASGSGSSGTFTQSGGTLTLSSSEALAIASTGTFNLSGGTLNIGGTTSGAGNFNIGGGNIVVTGAAWANSLNGTLSGTTTLDTTSFGATLSGILSGSGTLNLTNGSNVSITGINNTGSSSWGANINGGTLQATVPNLSETGTFNIASGAGLVLNSSSASSDTFAGNITGTGNLTTGTKPLVLTGNTNLTGASITTIGSGGSLEVDKGTISNIHGSSGSSSNTFVVGNGTSTGTVNLLGTNTIPLATVSTGSTLLTNAITGSIANNGTLGSSVALPASSTPTVTLGGSGDLNQAATGTLLIRLNGTTSDLYSVNTAELNGTLKIVNGFGTNTYKIVEASSSLTLAPGLTLNPASGALLQETLLQIGNNLFLTTTQSLLTSFTLTPNESAVSSAIDPFIAANNSVSHTAIPTGLQPVLAGLNSLPAGSLPGALDQLSPEVFQYARDISFENSTFLVQKVNGVLANLRNGYSGFDGSGLTLIDSSLDSSLGHSLGSLLAYNSPDYGQPSSSNGLVNSYPQDSSSPPPSLSTPPQTISDSPVVSNSHSVTPPPADSPESSTTPPLYDSSKRNFSEFISGDFVLANLNNNQGVANAPPSKASYSAGGATAGVSYRATSNLSVGALLDYNHTDANTDSYGSRTKVDTFSPGLYGTFSDHSFYVNGLASFGYNSYYNSRKISYLGETATSSPTGQQYVGNLDFGYDFHPDQAWIVGPTLGLTYTHLNIDSFTETGAPGADLAVNSQSADSLRSRLGGHLIYQTRVGSISLQPNFNAMWQHEYLNKSAGITSSFSDFSSNPFTIQTESPNKDSALIGCGLTASIDRSIGVCFNYVADVGSDNSLAQSVIFGFKGNF